MIDSPNHSMNNHPPLYPLPGSPRLDPITLCPRLMHGGNRLLIKPFKHTQHFLILLTHEVRLVRIYQSHHLLQMHQSMRLLLMWTLLPALRTGQTLTVRTEKLVLRFMDCALGVLYWLFDVEIWFAHVASLEVFEEID